MVHDVTMNTLLINCRSLKTKISSLCDNFTMNKTSIAILTETWFTKNDRLLKTRLQNVGLETGIQIIRKDRNSRGGGVGIAYNQRESNFSKLKLK